ncbi:MAG TPA: Do family serine endopeptidase [Candidatus Binataceae bacterium]|nr:Do family serine endopeptidase [Candidatus Binataceae bacterium]
MTSIKLRTVSIVSVLIFAFAASGAAARAADGADASRFWTELPDSGHIAKAQTLPDFVGLAEKLSPAVVSISMDSAESQSEPSEVPEEHENPHFGPFEDFEGPHHPGKSLGSGFIVSKDGYIVTNDHVVDSGGKVTVTLQDGRNFDAKVIGHDAKSDIALIKIEAKGDLPIAPLGDSDSVKVGEWVVAIGNPYGFDHSVTAGIVSAKGRFISGNLDNFIQTDTRIDPGNSGGPLIDLRGEVVGVNSMIYTHTGASMGIGFVIPVNLVKDELPQLKTSGKVVRGWLGVYVQKMTPELAESMGLADTHGALVAEVLKNGPAKAAGVHPGDVIVALDGKPVESSSALPLMVGRCELGHQGKLKIVRDKRTIELQIKIAQSRETEVAGAEHSEKSETGVGSVFGLHVKDLNADLAQQLGIDEKSGVVISSVAPGSRGDDAGLRPLDVVLEVNKQAVRDVTSFQSKVKNGEKGKKVLLWIARGQNRLFVVISPEA